MGLRQVFGNQFGVVRMVGTLLALAVFALGTASCDDSLRSTQFPDLEASPDRIVLTPVPLGQSTRGVTTLRNRGGSRLRITEIAFTNATDEREFTKSHPDLPLILEANEEATLQVNFTPRVSVLATGGIVIRSNDADEPELEIPITTTAANTGLVVEPVALNLVADRIGATVSGTVKLSNLGLVPVNVLDAFLSTDTGPEFGTVDDIAARPSLGRDNEVVYTVTYTPADAVADRGELVLLTDDPSQPRVTVPLSGSLPRPAIVVAPDSVNFGAVDLNTETEITQLVLENRGSAPLTVDGIAFAFAAPPTNDQYTLHDLPEFPIVVEPDAASAIVFGISYHPAVDGRHRTAIAINSSDPVNGILTVPVDGRVRKPCISVTPGQVDFGRVALGQRSARQPLQVANCGDMPLAINDIVIDNPGYDWAVIDGSDLVGTEIAPLAAATIEVWYQNTDLEQGAPDNGILSITSNAPDAPQVDVPLSVAGGGAPTCDMVVLPGRVDFGLVSRRSSRSRELKLVNRGTGACEIRSEVIAPLLPIPGLPATFFLTRPVGARQAAPGEFLPFEITYRPQLFAADSATYTATYFDPFSNQEKMVSATVSGIGGESNIAVIPSRLDFGQVTAGQCASREERVSIYNTGIVDLCVRDLRFEGNCDEFFLVGRPVADANGCVVVNRNSPADFVFVYEPGNLGSDSCEVVFISDASDNPELRVPLAGEGVADSRQTDVFNQTSGRTVDVLFVIDNSGSMSEEQANLAANFANFIGGAQAFQNDYQLGVVTTDMDRATESGRLQGSRIIRRGPNVEREFEDTSDVGTNGAGEEKGLEAAQKALSDPLIFDSQSACNNNAACNAPDLCIEGFCGGSNRGFLRDDAALEVVFVSDEDDYSAGTLNFYVDFFKNIKGFRNEGRFRANAIVGANNGRAAACESNNGAADAGRRYVEVADRTNGQVFSICDASFGNSLREIGDRAFGLPVQFFLTRPAVPESIEVSVNGAPRRNGWTYDAPSNSILFDEAAVPQPGDRISVTYNAQCFPRRN